MGGAPKFPNHWEFIPFSVPWHQDLHTAEQTVCGCLSCFKKGENGKMLDFGVVSGGNCGEQSLVVVAAQPRVCPSPGVPGMWHRLLLGCSRASAFLVVPFPPPGSPQLPSLGIPGFLISWDLGVYSPSTMRVTGLSLSVASALVASHSSAPPSSSFGVPGLEYPKGIPLGMLVWHRGSTRSCPGKLREFWAVP